MSADGRWIHRTQCSTTGLCEASLSTSAGAVSWLVSERACIGLAWYGGAALFCTHASHIAGMSLAQPRWRRLDRHLLVSHRAWLSSNCMDGRDQLLDET